MIFYIRFLGYLNWSFMESSFLFNWRLFKIFSIQFIINENFFG